MMDLLKYYSKLHKKYPKKKYFVPLAEIYCEREYLDEAAQILQDGLKWNPTYFIARALLAHIYLKMGHPLQASLEAERVVQTDPKNLLALRILLRSHLRMGENQKGAVVVNQLLKVAPEDAEALKIKEKSTIREPLSDRPVGRIEDFQLKQLTEKKANKKIDTLSKLLIRVQSMDRLK